MPLPTPLLGIPLAASLLLLAKTGFAQSGSVTRDLLCDDVQIMAHDIMSARQARATEADALRLVGEIFNLYGDTAESRMFLDTANELIEVAFAYPVVPSHGARLELIKIFGQEQRGR